MTQPGSAQPCASGSPLVSASSISDSAAHARPRCRQQSGRCSHSQSRPLFSRMSAKGHPTSPDTHSMERMSSSRTLRLSRLVLACSLAAGCTASYTIRFTAAEIQHSLNYREVAELLIGELPVASPTCSAVSWCGEAPCATMWQTIANTSSAPPSCVWNRCRLARSCPSHDKERRGSRLPAWPRMS